MQYNENLINHLNPHTQIENNKASRAEYLHKYDSEDRETNKTSAILNLILKIFPDEETAGGVNSFNSKQKEVFNMVHKWDKNYVKYDGCDA